LFILYQLRSYARAWYRKLINIVSLHPWKLGSQNSKLLYIQGFSSCKISLMAKANFSSNNFMCLLDLKCKQNNLFIEKAIFSVSGNSEPMNRCWCSNPKNLLVHTLSIFHPSSLYQSDGKYREHTVPGAKLCTVASFLNPLDSCYYFSFWKCR